MDNSHVPVYQIVDLLDYLTFIKNKWIFSPMMKLNRPLLHLKDNIIHLWQSQELLVIIILELYLSLKMLILMDIINIL